MGAGANDPENQSTTKSIDFALHLRLRAGDPTATLDSIERWLLQLERQLSQRWPAVAASDHHFITTAAMDALLNYTQNGHPTSVEQKPTLRSYSS